MSDKQYAQTGRSMLILAWLILFILLFLFFRFYSQDEQGSYQIKPGLVTIAADGQGHYRIDGSINRQPVKFLIDTGATLVAIPDGLALKLNLKRRYAVTITTANGEVTGSLTRVAKLRFGNFTLYNVKAIIVPANEDNIVLLGMNVLSQFKLSQEAKRLIIKK